MLEGGARFQNKTGDVVVGCGRTGDRNQISTWMEAEVDGAVCTSFQMKVERRWKEGGKEVLGEWNHTIMAFNGLGKKREGKPPSSLTSTQRDPAWSELEC